MKPMYKESHSIIINRQYLQKLYIALFVSSGNRYFAGRDNGIFTISSSICSSESDAINDIIDVLFLSEGSLFQHLYEEYLNEGHDCVQDLKQESKGKISKLNEHFPDSECGVGSGMSFCFELKELSVECKNKK